MKKQLLFILFIFNRLNSIALLAQKTHTQYLLKTAFKKKLFFLLCAFFSVHLSGQSKPSGLDCAYNVYDYNSSCCGTGFQGGLLTNEYDSKVGYYFSYSISPNLKSINHRSNDLAKVQDGLAHVLKLETYTIYQTKKLLLEETSISNSKTHYPLKSKLAYDGGSETTIFKIRDVPYTCDNCGRKADVSLLNIRIHKSLTNNYLEDEIGKISLKIVSRDSIEFSYTHPQYKSANGPDSIKFELFRTGCDQYDLSFATFSLKLVPAPLLLIHGLGGTPESWATFKQYLIDKQIYTAELIYAPLLPPCDPFDPAYTNIETAIDYLLKTVIDKKISAKKVDMIGHSMGGILARYHLNNKGSEKVNRLITCNTPHWGSLLANIGFQNLNKYPWILDYKFVNSSLEGETGCNKNQYGAIADLRIGGVAIKKLFDDQKANSKVPTHALYSTISKASCLEDIVTIFAKKTFLPNSIYDCITESNEGSDGIVHERSQKGGLADACTSYTPNQQHMGNILLKQSPIMSRLEFLLKESPNNVNYFTKEGFKEPASDYNSPFQNLDMNLQFDPTLNNKKVKTGDTIIVKITKGAGIGTVVFLSSSAKSDSITLGQTQSTTPQFKYIIRSDYGQGYNIKLVAIAKVGNSYIVDSAILAVQSLPCPTPPTQPIVTGILVTSATVSWTPSSDNAVYLIEYRPSASTNWIALPSTTNTSVSLAGLTGATTYSVRVTADCNNTPSIAASITTLTPCNTPTITPSVSNIATTSAMVTWVSLGTGVSYLVEYTTQGGSSWIPLPITTSTSAIVAGLSSSTAYSVRVTAACNLSPSVAVNFTTIGNTVRTFRVGLPTCLEDDFRELEKLYNATNGDTWTNKTNWFTSNNMATWSGITLTPSGCDIQYIYLSGNNLVGELPMLSFPELLRFQGWNNKLTGAIPNFSMPKLVDFNFQDQNSGGDFTGSIPNFNMPNLKSLHLWGNKLSGTIPDFNMPLLEQLWLDGNLLTGSLPAFSALSNLKELNISSNQLTGSIPNFSLSKLISLNLRSNQLSGTVPDFAMPLLTQLYLDNNQFSGSMPSLSNTGLLSAPPTYRRIWFYGNKFIFGDIEGKPWLNTTDVRYEPQTKIPITFSGANISVNTGSVNNVQQFSWYKNDVLLVTNQNNTFTPTASGKYYCKISHNNLTTTSDTSRNFILQSEDYTVTSVLPVELLTFTAHPLSKTVQLNWQTASEKNASHFVVEHSSDGKTFYTIGQVKAKGNSSSLENYAFTDETPLNGVNYYRLRQLDTDGKETLSNSVSVTMHSTQKLKTYPNPVSNYLSIETESTGTFQIINLLGQEVMHGKVANRIDVCALPQGTYILKIGSEQARFVKH